MAGVGGAPTGGLRSAAAQWCCAAVVCGRREELGAVREGGRGDASEEERKARGGSGRCGGRGLRTKEREGGAWQHGWARKRSKAGEVS